MKRKDLGKGLIKISRVVRFMVLLMGFTFLSAQTNKPQIVANGQVLDSMAKINADVKVVLDNRKAMLMRLRVGVILKGIEKDLQKIEITNVDTLKWLKRNVALKTKKNKKEIELKENQIITYKIIPIIVDTIDIEMFNATYPNDTIPAQINIEKIQKKRNIFDKVKGLFKRKNKN